MDILICPVCGEKIKKYQGYYRCQKNHSFDIAKEGYTNLLLNQSSHSHGDRKDMLQARKYIQEQGYYKAVAEAVVAIIKTIQPKYIVDIGCGIGYYTSYVHQALKANVVGIDISKEALKMAAKDDSTVAYFVASNNMLPLIDDSVDLIMNIFSPVYINEVARVLRSDGYIIVVSPNVDHLIELKEVIYEQIIHKDEERNDIHDACFSLVKELRVKESVKLDRKSLDMLFLMTPHYWTSSLSGKAKLHKIDDLTLTIDVNIKLYQWAQS